MQRLPLILSATALAVALLGSTPLGKAAGSAAAKVVPLAKRSGYAGNAGAVGGIKASRTPTPERLLPLGRNGRFPASVLPPGARGEPGPPGISGLQFVHGLSRAGGGDVAEAHAFCPEGKQLIGGGVVPNERLPDGYVAVTESGPSVDKTYWIAKAMEVKPYTPAWTIEAWAICANVAS